MEGSPTVSEESPTVCLSSPTKILAMMRGSLGGSTYVKSLCEIGFTFHKNLRILVKYEMENLDLWEIGFL